MFTGIIEHVGVVRGRTRGPVGQRLEIDLGPLAGDAKRGDSFAINGACLTAANFRDTTVAAFDVARETLERTTLGTVVPGEKVNIERAMQLTGRLGGHLVQGHVDGVGTVRQLIPGAEQWTLSIEAPEEIFALLVEKGSVAVSGVSLTIAKLDGNQTFTCAIIPTTLEETTLAQREPGNRVNIETDIIGRYVRRFLAAGPAAGPAADTTLRSTSLRSTSAAPLSLDTLKEHGFA